MPDTTARPAETQRRRRGHAFYAPKADLRKVPALRATDDVKAEDKIVRLHYFGGPIDVWVVEIDPATQEAYGYTRIAGHGEGEWGYTDLPTLEEVNVPPLTIIERDLYWEPTRFGDLNR